MLFRKSGSESPRKTLPDQIIAHLNRSHGRTMADPDMTRSIAYKEVLSALHHHELPPLGSLAIVFLDQLVNLGKN